MTICMTFYRFVVAGYVCDLGGSHKACVDAYLHRPSMDTRSARRDRLANRLSSTIPSLETVSWFRLNSQSLQSTRAAPVYTYAVFRVHFFAPIDQC